MFRHLKAEEFVNLLEGNGAALSSMRRAHVESCATCNATLQSMRSMHSGLSHLDNDIPEPDWAEFRSSVRDELLSRSVQRTSAVRRWTGWPVRPAVAWAFSLVLTVGVTSGMFLWMAGEEPQVNPAAPVVENVVSPVVPDAIDLRGLQNEIKLWSQTNVFEGVAQLDKEEQEQLRLILESAQEETAVRE